MDEAVAGHASRIEVTLDPGNRLTVTDNGRGIPVDPHPKYPGKSALEVIMTTLHSGGKFEGKAYSTSGGLHGVGVSVVNALSTETIVEVARDKKLFRQTFSKGLATSQAGGRRRRPQPPRHHHHLHARSGDLRRRREVQPRAPLQARPLQGVSVRRRRDSLALRPVAHLRGSAGAGRLPVPRRARRPPRRAGRRAPDRHQPALHRPPGLPSRCQRHAAGQRRMGGRLAALFRRQRKLLLQHHPDPRRRHPRGGAARRADQGHPRVRRSCRQQEGEGHHRRRRHERRRADAQRLHPQPAFPEPDQGPPDQPRGGALRRGCGARPFRPLPRRQHGPRPRAARQHSRPHGGAPQAPRRARGPAQDRDQRPQASPTGQAHRLRQRRRRRHRDLHRRGRQRRRLGQAGPRPQDPGDPADPRQDPQRRLAPPRTRSAPTARSPTSSSRSAAASATSGTRTRSATSGSSS